MQRLSIRHAMDLLARWCRGVAFFAVDALPEFRGKRALFYALGSVLTSSGNSQVVGKMPNRMLINLDLLTPEHKAVYFFGGFDERQLAFCRRVLDVRHSVFVDIGASVGIYTLGVADIVAQNGGAILAFEPYEPNRLLLIRSLELNELACAEVYGVALSDRRTEYVMQVSSKAPVGNAVARPATDADERTVVAVPLDEFEPFQARVERIDLVKIDIEGYDLLALEGMKDTLLRYRPIVLAELHRARMRALGIESSRLGKLLDSLRYSLISLDGSRLSLQQFSFSQSDVFLVPDERVGEATEVLHSI